MRRASGFAIFVAAAPLLLFALPSSQLADTAFADEEVLSCDDGDSGWHYAQGWEGCRRVVMYEAPAWANWLVAVQYYVSFFDEFYLVVLAPPEGSATPPDSLRYVQLVPDRGDVQTRFEWVEVRLEEPVEIGDQGAFPGRIFFAGAEWIHYLQPHFALDTVEPVHGCTWSVIPGEEWQNYTNGDVMIRAVVSDTANTPVDGASWSTLKVLYR